MSTIKKLYPGANITLTDSPSTGHITIAAPTATSTTGGPVATPPNDPMQEFQGDAVWRYSAPWKRYNAIRNPEMIVAQRGASGTAGGYTVDGWSIGLSGSTVASWSQLAAAIPADTSGNNWFPYIPYALRTTITTASGTLAAGNAVYITQPVEGLLAETLKSGVTSISFLVRSSITGTFAVSLKNYANTYSIVYSVTIATANVWQRVTISNIPLFTTSGTFPDGAAGCYSLSICLATGSTYATATTGSWISGNYLGTTTQTNFAATSGTTFDITAVQHEPNPVCTPYIKREVADETALSTRYLIMIANFSLGYTLNGTVTYSLGAISFPAMRAAPATVPGATYVVSSGAAGVPIQGGIGGPSCVYLVNSSANWTVGVPVLFNGGFTAEL